MNTPFRLVFGLLIACGFAGCSFPVKEELNIVYGEAGGQKLLLDVFRPVTPDKNLRAAILVVHGGAWRSGNKEELQDFAKNLAKRGYVSFAINYRLVTPTGNRWPAQLDDAQRAVRWVRANAARFGVDPQRVGATGGSAGGHIVACLGTSDTRDNSDPALAAYSSRVSCVIDMCGPTDLTQSFAPKVKQGAWADEQVAALLGGTAAQVPEVARSASPLFHVDASSAPALIIHGRNDDLVPLDQAERYAEALKKAGVDARLFVHNGGHGLDDTEALVRLIEELSAFLDKHFPPVASPALSSSITP